MKYKFLSGLEDWSDNISWNIGMTFFTLFNNFIFHSLN